jgi:hypothetical protein
MLLERLQYSDPLFYFNGNLVYFIEILTKSDFPTITQRTDKVNNRDNAVE